jgi:hypothetical protein
MPKSEFFPPHVVIVKNCYMVHPSYKWSLRDPKWQYWYSPAIIKPEGLGVRRERNIFREKQTNSEK